MHSKNMTNCTITPKQNFIKIKPSFLALEKVGISTDIFGVDPVPKDVFVKRTKEVLEEQQANYVAKN